MPWVWELGRQESGVSQMGGFLKVSTVAKSSPSARPRTRCVKTSSLRASHEPRSRLPKATPSSLPQGGPEGVPLVWYQQ